MQCLACDHVREPRWEHDFYGGSVWRWRGGSERKIKQKSHAGVNGDWQVMKSGKSVFQAKWQAVSAGMREDGVQVVAVFYSGNFFDSRSFQLNFFKRTRRLL